MSDEIEAARLAATLYRSEAKTFGSDSPRDRIRGTTCRVCRFATGFSEGSIYREGKRFLAAQRALVVNSSCQLMLAVVAYPEYRVTDT